MEDEDQQAIGLFALEKCESPVIDDSTYIAVTPTTTFESNDAEIITSTRCATTEIQRDVVAVEEASVEQSEDGPQCDTPQDKGREQMEEGTTEMHDKVLYLEYKHEDDGDEMPVAAEIEQAETRATTSKAPKNRTLEREGALKKRPSAAAVVSSEILIDVDDNFDDQSRSSEIEVARVVSSLQVDVPRQKGPFLVDDGSSRTVSTANSTPVATSLAHLSVLSANFTALPGRTQNLQHDEEDIDDDDSSRFPAWLSLRGRATRDDDSIAPSTDATTYRRAIERVRVIQEEEDQQLFTKKNLYATLFLKLKRWRRSFQFSIWSTRIQAVEGKHGSNVGLTLYFLRWTVLLNLFISLLWIAFTVVPFVVYPPDTFSWDLFTESSTADIISGNVLGYTWFLYGGYQYPVNATYGGVYEPGIAFPLASCLMLFGSLISLLMVIGKRISGEGNSSVIEQNQTYPFSSVVFASWDFHIKEAEAVRNLKNALRSQIREMLHDAEWNQKTTTFQEQLLTGTTKLIGTLVLWPLIVCFTAAAMFYTIDKGDVINHFFSFSFAQSITITCISLAGQVSVRSTVKYEGWHPRVAQQVDSNDATAKLISLAVILYKLYDIQERATAATERLEESGPGGMNTCDGDNADACGVGLRCCDDVCAHRLSASYLGRCVPICEENEMGMIFYRLVMTNGFILLIQEVLQALVVSKCFKNPPSLDAAKFFVDIIDTQALVWLGSIVAPLLPLFGIISNIANFFVKTWLALYIYDPPVTTCSAARNSNMQYNLMLLTLLFSTLPVTSFFYEDRDMCGPNADQSMADALSRRMHRVPSFIKTLIRWLTNPLILGGLLFVAVFFFLLERVHKRKYRREATESKTEFAHYRRDMRLKMQETRSRTASSHCMGTWRYADSQTVLENENSLSESV